MTDIFNQSPQALAELMRAWGETPFRVRQIIEAAWTPGIANFSQATALPKALRERLDRTFLIPPPLAPKTILRSEDGTAKALFDLQDGFQIESVSIPLPNRLTFCLSSQVGCGLGCRFCATARMGFIRQLTAGEMAGQLRALMALNRRPPTNIVLMGMGEPLQNLEAVRAFIDLIHHPKALNASANKTTISTSGWLPGLEALMADPIPAKMAFSFNAPTDALRDQLMPVNRRYPLGMILAALKKYARAKGETITVEYVLLRGVNDRPEDARILGRRLKSLPCKINLIPFNETPGIPYQAPEAPVVENFRTELIKLGLLTTMRVSRGAAIGAACGQLARMQSRRAA